MGGGSIVSLCPLLFRSKSNAPWWTVLSRPTAADVLQYQRSTQSRAGVQTSQPSSRNSSNQNRNTNININNNNNVQSQPNHTAKQGDPEEIRKVRPQAVAKLTLLLNILLTIGLIIYLVVNHFERKATAKNNSRYNEANSEQDAVASQDSFLRLSLASLAIILELIFLVGLLCYENLYLTIGYALTLPPKLVIGLFLWLHLEPVGSVLLAAWMFLLMVISYRLIQYLITVRKTASEEFDVESDVPEQSL